MRNKLLTRIAQFLIGPSLSVFFIATAQAAESDWITLIENNNGLHNFEVLGDANWTATAEGIEATSGSGASWLVSKDSYSNFELRIEFWASDDANSGIYMRCADRNRITDRDCYEANIFDQRPEAAYGTGGIVHVAAVSEPLPKAGNRWNTYIITLRDDNLQVVLNGETTAQAQDSKLSSGPIALQWGRGTIRFRKVEIRPID